MVTSVQEMIDVWTEFVKERLSRVVHVNHVTVVGVESNQDSVSLMELVTQMATLDQESRVR